MLDLRRSRSRVQMVSQEVSFPPNGKAGGISMVCSMHKAVLAGLLCGFAALLGLSPSPFPIVEPAALRLECIPRPSSAALLCRVLFTR